MLAAMLMPLPSSRQPNNDPSALTEAPHLIGRSDAVRKLVEAVGKAAEAPSPVLIVGEPGTGKGLVAKMLHHLSGRGRGPFVAVDCASVRDSLMDASTGRQGHWESATSGTLYLADIVDLSRRAQGDLLRALGERTETKVSGAPIHVDVRLIAGTHVVLEEAIRDGRFREDLYHQLNAALIRVPPLRDRREDIPLLVADVLGRMSGGQTPPKAIAPEALERLGAYNWPGNVGELITLIEQLAATSGDVIQEIDLPPNIRTRARTRALAEAVRHGSISLTQAVDAFERELILEALEHTRHVQVRAAKWLGVTRRILKYKMDLLGIPVKRPRVRRTRREAA
jgi:DNA-binding NtrC family response regulator